MTDLPQKFAALFIDVPNVQHMHTQGEVYRLYSIDEINWESLVSRMLDSLGADHIFYTGIAYHFAADGRKRTADRITEALRRGLAQYRNEVKTFVRSVKHIDVAIVNDIWECFVGMIRMQQELGARQPFEVTMLLAGGDGAYGFPIRSIRGLFGEEMKLRLHTFTWSGNISSSLLHESQSVEFLDRMHPPLIRQLLVG